MEASQSQPATEIDQATLNQALNLIKILKLTNGNEERALHQLMRNEKQREYALAYKRRHHISGRRIAFVFDGELMFKQCLCENDYVDIITKLLDVCKKGGLVSDYSIDALDRLPILALKS